MKKIICLLILALLISGCATTDWNRFWGTGYYGICPICKNNIVVYDTTSNYTCCYCGKVISAQEAIRLYSQYGNTPQDYVICPKCNTLADARFIPQTQSLLKCGYCGFEFERANGKKLFNEYYAKLYPYFVMAQAQTAAAEAQRQAAASQIFLQMYQGMQQQQALQQQQLWNSIFNNSFRQRRTRGTIRPDGLGGYIYEETQY